MEFGLNLYSIRKLIGTEEEFLATAIKLKEMGYSFMQFSGTSYDAEKIKRVSEASGLPVVLTHVDIDRILNDTEKLIEEHNYFGCKNIGLGGMKNGVMSDDKTWKETLDKLNVAGEKIEKSGSKFFFHQHHYEFNTFEDGTRVNSDYKVTNDGVEISARGDNAIAFALPAFCFDGETYTKIIHNGNTLTVAYEGWICKYTADCTIKSLDTTAYNRNGHYRVFYAEAKNNLNVKIEIIKE